MYLLDTNIFVHLVREDEVGRYIAGRYNLKAYLRECGASVVTKGETQKVIYEYAELDTFSGERGIKVGKNDLWVAAAARAENLTLRTTDADFDHVAAARLVRLERVTYPPDAE